MFFWQLTHQCFSNVCKVYAHLWLCRLRRKTRREFRKLGFRVGRRKIFAEFSLTVAAVSCLIVNQTVNFQNLGLPQERLRVRTGFLHIKGFLKILFQWITVVDCFSDAFVRFPAINSNRNLWIKIVSIKMSQRHWRTFAEIWWWRWVWGSSIWWVLFCTRK